MPRVTYDERFYEHQQNGAQRSAACVIPVVLEFVNPSSVIDIGCGQGAWLSEWKRLGVRKIRGVDGDYVNRRRLLIPESDFRVHDLDREFRCEERFDLASCLEVAEHIDTGHASGLVKSLTQLSDVILFSAAIPGQEGTHHVNEQYPSYWVERFHRSGYVPIDCLRMVLWNNEAVEWWYRQNLLFLVREESLAGYPRLDAIHRVNGDEVPHLVHPGLLSYKSAKTAYYERALRGPVSTARYFASALVRRLQNRSVPE